MDGEGRVRQTHQGCQGGRDCGLSTMKIFIGDQTKLNQSSPEIKTYSLMTTDVSHPLKVDIHCVVLLLNKVLKLTFWNRDGKHYSGSFSWFIFGIEKCCVTVGHITQTVHCFPLGFDHPSHRSTFLLCSSRQKLSRRPTLGEDRRVKNTL